MIEKLEKPEKSVANHDTKTSEGSRHLDVKDSYSGTRSYKHGSSRDAENRNGREPFSSSRRSKYSKPSESSYRSRYGSEVVTRSEKQFFGKVIDEEKKTDEKSSLTESSKINGHAGSQDGNRAEKNRSISPTHQETVTIESDVYGDREFNEAERLQRHAKLAEPVSSERTSYELDHGTKRQSPTESDSDAKSMETDDSLHVALGDACLHSSTRLSAAATKSGSMTSTTTSNGNESRWHRETSRASSFKSSDSVTSEAAPDDTFFIPQFSALLINYPKFISEAELLKMFEKYGEFEKTHSFETSDRDTGKILIKYQKSSEAAKAYEEMDMHGYLLHSSDFKSSAYGVNQTGRLEIRLMNKKYEHDERAHETSNRDDYEKMRKLFVKIGPQMTDDDLRDIFEKWGTLTKAQVLYYKNKTSKCLAYVTFLRASDSARAMEECSPSFCAKFAFVPSAYDSFPTYLNDRWFKYSTTKPLSPRHEISSSFRAKKRSLSPASRREETDERDNKSRKIERSSNHESVVDETKSSATARSKNDTKDKPQLKAQISETFMSTTPSPVAASSSTRTFRDEFKPAIRKTLEQQTVNNKNEPQSESKSDVQSKNLEKKRPIKLDRSESTPYVANVAKESSHKSSNVASVKPSESKSTAQNGTPKQPSDEKALIEFSKTTLCVKTKLDEKTVRSLVDLVPTFKDLTLSKIVENVNDSQNEFLVKYVDEKMAAHAKVKLGLLELPNGEKLKVEYLKISTSRINAQQKPPFKSSLSLNLNDCKTLSVQKSSEPSEVLSLPCASKSELKPGNSSATKLKDFSLASILGLPCKIENKLTSTSPKLPETPKTSPPTTPSKLVDPRLERREQANKQTKTDNAESSGTNLLRMTSSEPSKKTVVVHIECEKPTTKDAMKLVLSQFNNLISVIMNSTDFTKAYAVFANEEDAILAATTLNNKKIADNYIKLAKTDSERAHQQDGLESESKQTPKLSLDSLFRGNDQTHLQMFPGTSLVKNDLNPSRSYEAYLESILRVPTPFSYLIPQTSAEGSTRSINLREYYMRTHSLN